MASKNAITWGIFTKNNKTLIGECGIHSWDKKNNKAQIGYIINQKYWRNGYANEALNELIKYAFNNINLKEIFAETDPENIPSSQLLVKLEFVFVKTIKNHFTLNEIHHDTDVYALINKNV